MGLIKKLLSGILSFFVGLLRGNKAEPDKLNPASAKATNKPKKRSGYFMELDESEDNGNLLTKIDPAAVVKQVQQTASTVTKQAKETVSTATGKVQETANAATGKAKETAFAATGKAKETVDAASTQVKETTKSAAPLAATKSAPETNKIAEPATQPKSKVELVQTAEGLKAEPIKNEPSVVASNGQKADTTFAPKYLNPATASNSRRRPGANMTSFLDMAKQVKSPAKG